MGYPLNRPLHLNSSPYNSEPSWSRDRILRPFFFLEIRQISPYFGATCVRRYTDNLQKNPLEKMQRSSVDVAILSRARLKGWQGPVMPSSHILCPNLRDLELSNSVDPAKWPKPGSKNPGSGRLLLSFPKETTSKRWVYWIFWGLDHKFTDILLAWTQPPPPWRTPHPTLPTFFNWRATPALPRTPPHFAPPPGRKKIKTS